MGIIFESKQDHLTVRDALEPGIHNDRWHVHFLGPISAPFPIFYVSPDYNYLLFGYPNRQMGWIYSLYPKLDEEKYRALLLYFKNNGYEESKI